MNLIVSTDRYYSDEISKELVEYLYKGKEDVKNDVVAIILYCINIYIFD